VLGRRSVLVAAFNLSVVGVPLTHVVLSLNERFALNGEVAHARRRDLIAGAVDAFRVFTAGEFDGAGSAGKEHGVAIEAVFVFDHDGLTANHVGGAVEKEGGRNATGKAVVDGLIVIVEGVDHHHVRGDGAGGFVNVTAESDVGMGVDNAGSEVLAASIDHGDAGRSEDFGADGSDLAVFDVNAAAGNVAVCGGHDDSVFDEDVGGKGRRGVLRQGSQADRDDSDETKQDACGLA